MIGRFLSKKIFTHPIFIIGEGRSGTSVLLQALDKHPKILASKGEAPLITSMGGIIANFELGNDSTRKYYSKSLHFKRTYLDNFLRRFCFEIAMGENYGLKFISKKIISSPPQFLKKNFWAAKTFPSELVANGLLKLYPEAKFIYIVRNGIDVVHSKTRFHGFREKDFIDHCHSWKYNILKYQYVSNLQEGIKIHHEQLIDETSALFERLYDFIGIESSEAPINFVNNNIVHPLDKPSQFKVSAKDILKKRPPAYESWGKEQRNIFKDICGDAMKENNYDIPF